MPTDWQQEIYDEWMVTRERISDHIVRIRPPRLHAVGDPKAEALKVSLEKLERWRGEIDEMMVDLLMQDLA